MLDGQVGDVDVFHAEAHVGLVVAKTLHRVCEREPGKLPSRVSLEQVDAQDLFPKPEHEPFQHLEQVILVDERHLDVDLGELGLPIDAQVLVPEASDDLVVLVVPGAHQQLLVELRALGERIEMPSVES